VRVASARAGVPGSPDINETTQSQHSPRHGTQPPRDRSAEVLRAQQPLERSIGRFVSRVQSISHHRKSPGIIDHRSEYIRQMERRAACGNVRSLATSPVALASPHQRRFRLPHCTHACAQPQRVAARRGSRACPSGRSILPSATRSSCIPTQGARAASPSPPPASRTPPSRPHHLLAQNHRVAVCSSEDTRAHGTPTQPSLARRS